MKRRFYRFSCECNNYILFSKIYSVSIMVKIMTSMKQALIALGIMTIILSIMSWSLYFICHNGYSTDDGRDRSEGNALISHSNETTDFSDNVIRTINADENENSSVHEEINEENEYLKSHSSSHWSSDSPEIFFHVENKTNTDLMIRINDGVTCTIPKVPMDSSAIWAGLTIYPNGSISYNNKVYDMIYYEGKFVDSYPISNQGWVISKIGENMFVKDQKVNENDLLDLLMNEMSVSGLTNYEIEFVLNRIVQNDMLDCNDHYLTIRYIPQKNVDEVINLSSSIDFQIMRRHFLIEETDECIPLVDPIFEPIPIGPNIIHETAVNRI